MTAPGDAADRGPTRPPSLIQPASLASRALAVIVAIMAFLASLTIGAVDLVSKASDDWTSSILREATIQIRPAAGRSIEADVARAVEIARGTRGVADASAFSATDTVRMLEPWLGSGLAIADLPIPRLIVLRLAADGAADLPALRRALTAALPTASLDDHRQWFDRLRAMARAVVIAGAVIIVLMIVATALSVIFATRAAVATNRPVVEVLHFVGARDSFIAGQFMRHFLWVGFKGALAGAGAAIALFFASGRLFLNWRGAAEADQMQALFGSFELSAAGYGAIAGLALIVAGVTALTSRLTVMRVLGTID